MVSWLLYVFPNILVSSIFGFPEFFEGPGWFKIVREANRNTVFYLHTGFPLELIGTSLLNSPFKKGSGGFFRVNSKFLTSKCWFSHGLIVNILV